MDFEFQKKPSWDQAKAERAPEGRSRGLVSLCSADVLSLRDRLYF